MVETEGLAGTIARTILRATAPLAPVPYRIFDNLRDAISHARPHLDTPPDVVFVSARRLFLAS